MTSSGNHKKLKYYAFPGLSSPKIWISEKDRPSNALKLYNPSSLRGKVVKYFFSSAPKFIVHTILKSRSPLFISEIDSLLLEHFGGDELTASYYMATDGNDKKTTVQISKNNKIYAYVKISSDSKYRKYIENEFRALKTLNSDSNLKKHVPSVLFQEEEDKYYILCQSAPVTKMKQRTLSFNDADTYFLSLLTKKHLRTIPLQDYINNIDNVLSNNELLSEISHLRQWLLSYGNNEIAFSPAHGDYTPWNTYIIDRRIYAFDWEYYMETAPVLYDAMHFLYMRAWLVRKNTPAETVRNLVKLVDNNGLNSMLARSHINK
ncbi:hypothetical protein KAR91_81350, partial [Candidatus Pacearchaeota archaeon]|nr:hypothetical protein [Candidatus Pacearchaeota archaeon]